MTRIIPRLEIVRRYGQKEAKERKKNMDHYASPEKEAEL